ncbi:MAG: hypothetical protein ACTFAL_16955 [Candidatus Electronema sp. V4]|uniref:hypothetical protein n=1 Tax=Candidatus Electronema sp. V4 TaxID=3454756 RepID=UPI0040555B4B
MKSIPCPAGTPAGRRFSTASFELLAHLGATVREETITEHHVTADLLGVDLPKRA